MADVGSRSAAMYRTAGAAGAGVGMHSMPPASPSLSRSIACARAKAQSRTPLPLPTHWRHAVRAGTTRLRQSTSRTVATLKRMCMRLAHEPDSGIVFGTSGPPSLREGQGGGRADLLEDQLRMCCLQLVDVPSLPPINTQRLAAAHQCASALSQYRCGRGANAHPT